MQRSTAVQSADDARRSERQSRYGLAAKPRRAFDADMMAAENATLRAGVPLMSRDEAKKIRPPSLNRKDGT
jgi:hypothetical protein